MPSCQTAAILPAPTRGGESWSARDGRTGARLSFGVGPPLMRGSRAACCRGNRRVRAVPRGFRAGRSPPRREGPPQRWSAAGPISARPIGGGTMKSILAVLASMMTVAALAGQSSRDPASDRDIVAVGCVNRATPTGSLAAAPGVAPATPNTAGALANSADDPTNAFVLKGATTPEATEETRTNRGRRAAACHRAHHLCARRRATRPREACRTSRGSQGDLARGQEGDAGAEDRGPTHRRGIDPNAVPGMPRGIAGSAK